MATAETDESTLHKPIRLWPGVAAVVLQWLCFLGLPLVVPGYAGVLAAVAGGLLVVVWWLFFSRAPWSERLGALALIAVAVYATTYLLDVSVATAGQGILYYIYSVPIMSLALVVWAVVSRGLASGPRRAALVAVVALACGGWTLLRTEGTSSYGSDFRWRWSQTPEERLLALADDEPPVPAAVELAPEAAVAETPAAEEPPAEEPVAMEPVAMEPAAMELATIEPAAEPEPEWPGFRGPGRDGVVRGVRIATDWSTSPPAELWRKPIGPGWSSFAVAGDRIYTQEQRGDDEIVACYDSATGGPVWRHRDANRFWESNAGAGPRGTPTLAVGRVYAFGATGTLSALDAGNGAVVWSRDAASDVESTGVDADSEGPTWGFASSPLVVGDALVVAVSGTLVGYDLATGEPRWRGPAGGVSYSSPHLLILGGVEQVLLLSSEGATSVAPADGTLLWRHEWPGFGIVQPARTAAGDLLISADAVGTQRISVAKGPGGWAVEEGWTSNRLKANFNDFVIHQGHAYGFDGSILASIDVESGERRWKGGRYGQGQLVLLADQDLLLVVTERGELALVAATPETFTELARFEAIEGKTWNHPVVVGDLLLVRNGEEMAAFRLPRSG